MEEPNRDKTSPMRIVGINLGIMFVYTLTLRILSKNEGVFLVMFLLAAHFIICLFIAPFINGKAFLLSALAVLLIGFSTCFIAYTIR